MNTTKRTKIVATVGPATASKKKLKAIIAEGVNVIADASNVADSAVIRVSHPIRLGGIIDQIEYFQQKNSHILVEY